MDWAFRIVCIAIGYAFGCFQTAYIVGKVAKNIDVRNFGSGNAGTTNVIRVIGRRAGIITLIGDMLKMLLAYLVCSLIFGGNGIFLGGWGLNEAEDAVRNILPGLYAGLGVVIGHNWPVVMRFKGGKGIASMLGLMLCINSQIAIILYAIGIIILVFTKYVSLMSLVLSLLFPILVFLHGYDIESIIICTLLTVFAFYRHNANIKRLLSGTESKLNIGGKGK